MARNGAQSRRFGGALELFAASEWEWQSRGESDTPDSIVTLHEATLRHPYEGIRKDFEALSIASAIVEVALRISVPETECGPVFQVVSNALLAVEESSDSAARYMTLTLTLLKILQWYGNQPILDACLECSAPVTTAAEPFSARLDPAGWVCANCHSPAQFEFQISQASLGDLLIGLSMPIRKFLKQYSGDQRTAREVFRYIEKVFSYHIPGFDRSALKSLQALPAMDSESTGPHPGANPR
jgi:DNA repair protein RecO